MSDESAFQLLHDGVRRQIYSMKWETLHRLQADAIRAVLGHSTGHVILSAATASGKTEAAFLPVLSSIADEPAGSIRAIYVGPLKALINDQFQRVEQLCAHLDVPVHRWHGDVGAAAKASLIKRPGGVLLITPESLESLFVNRSDQLGSLFGGLRFVVIDELHSFLDNPRGRHLRSLLYRVAARAQTPVRLIGLSATLGDPSPAKSYLDRQHPESVRLILGASQESELRIKVHAYRIFPPVPGKDISTAVDDETPPHALQMAGDLVAHCRGATNLVFANSRSAVEEFAELCQRLASGEGLRDLFTVHHGSLSADFRQQTEQAMKQSAQSGLPVTTFCSSTLEMGVDIGSVKTVGQIGAPFSVASLTQRVGRSGRTKGQPRILRGYLNCKTVDANSSLLDRLHLPLVRMIATIELMLQQSAEPAEPSSFDLSTLTQQLISLIAETGGVSAAQAYPTLCEDGAFVDVRPADFMKLLRQLNAEDVVEQTPDGLLILGLAGEDIRKDKGFYSAFLTGDEFAVAHDGQRIGSVDRPPEVKQHMILAGRRWEVVDVNLRQRVVFVRPATGRKAAPFAGGGGMMHARVVAEMKKVLGATNVYRYLDACSTDVLNEARAVATVSNVCTSRLVQIDSNTTALFPWVGGRTFDTLKATFKASKVAVEGHDGLALTLKLSPAGCTALFNRLHENPPAEAAVLAQQTGPPADKYDELLGDSLRIETRRRRWLDLSAALNAIRPR